MKFDYIIGNPPYQEQIEGDNKNSAAPIYPQFLDSSFKIGKAVELIHPARFLFNAGSTSKSWNEKMLNDKHFKILSYEANSSLVFPGTDIKGGGVAVSLHNADKTFDPIKIFTSFPELTSLLKKVTNNNDFVSFSSIVVTRTAYRFTDKMHKDNPTAISKLSNGHPYDMSTNIFDRLPNLFTDKKPEDGHEYIQILGRDNNQRSFKFIRADYVNNPDNLSSWKVFVPAANGSGALGEVLSTPLIGQPLIGQPLNWAYRIFHKYWEFRFSPRGNICNEIH